MEYISKDPLFQGVALTIGVASGVAGIAPFGHQLYFNSTAPLTEAQVEALLEKFNIEQEQNLKAIVKNEVDDKLEIWDIAQREKVTSQEKEIRSLKNQRNTVVVALAVVISVFW